MLILLHVKGCLILNTHGNKVSEKKQYSNQTDLTHLTSA